MDPPHPIADPIPDHAHLKLDMLSVSLASQAAAGPPDVCEELDRYDIAVILEAAYEWGGQRYANASDAIAAAKGGAK